MTDYDDLELDRLEVFTRLAVKERGGGEHSAPLLGRMHRLDGEMIEVGFLNVASVGELVDSMNPRLVTVFAGASENAADIRNAIFAGARSGGLH